jgi:hypothetical protein
MGFSLCRAFSLKPLVVTAIVHKLAPSPSWLSIT